MLSEWQPVIPGSPVQRIQIGTYFFAEVWRNPYGPSTKKWLWSVFAEGPFEARFSASQHRARLDQGDERSEDAAKYAALTAAELIAIDLSVALRGETGE